MRRSFAILLTMAMVIGTFAFVPESVDAGINDDYPGQHKVISGFESPFSDITPYGNWHLTNPVSGLPGLEATRTYGPPKIEGANAMRLHFDVLNNMLMPVTFDRYRYEFTSNVSNLYQTHTPAFYYIGNATGGVGAEVQYWTTDSNGFTLTPVYLDVMALDDAWHLQVLSNLFVQNGTTYHIIINFGTHTEANFAGAFDPSGEGNLTLDSMYSDSPACSVRFSFYNQYTGLGQESDLLIPEVWWNGTWVRVWKNEVEVAAGEIISYRVSDYFGRTLAWVPILRLNSTVYYADISVPLVKVHISRPSWYGSSLPPQWDVTYLPTGQNVVAAGWELELIAGWYMFSWPESDVAEAGEVEAYVSGNATAHSALSMQDFSLVLEPTWSASGGVGTPIGKAMINLTSLIDLFNELQDTSWFGAAMFVVGVVTICGFAIAVSRSAARKARELQGRPDDRGGPSR